MFYIKQNENIVLFDEIKENIENTLKFMPQYADLPILKTDKEIIEFNGEFVFAEDVVEEQAQKEKERIQELFMTRSDFFDGTIMAWGVDEAALLPLIASMVNSMPLDDRLKLKAMNNFKNALNFYRKHDLFNLLVNIPLQLSESVQVIITDEHLDKFFDEVAKGNKDTAWQYLPQPMAINQ